MQGIAGGAEQETSARKFNKKVQDGARASRNESEVDTWEQLRRLPSHEGIHLNTIGDDLII